MSVNAVKPPPDRPILAPSQTKPWATPPRVIILPNIPTMRRIRASSFMIFEDMHEPIIDKDTWERVQKLRKNRRRPNRHRRSRHRLKRAPPLLPSPPN